MTTDTDLKQAAQEAIDREGEAEGAKKTQATLLVEIAMSEAELWHRDDKPWATVPVGDHREHLPLRSKRFREGWLERSFFARWGKAPGSQALVDAINTLRGLAIFDGPAHPVATRVAHHEGSILLDLANERWQAVEITADGWRVVDDPPVRFRRTRAMLQLPTPEGGGSLEELRRFVNVSSGEWPLLRACLVAALCPWAQYPVLVLHGPQGAAKSTTARVIRSLMDPNIAELRAVPRELRDLAIGASNAWVVALDNLSRLPDWLSDALCRLSTGGGFATRELYSDTEEMIFDARRPVILTSITEVVNRPDLLDRGVILSLPPLDEETRIPERELWATFEEVRPRILGALLDSVVMALRTVNRVNLDHQLPRMADFAEWAVASEGVTIASESAFLAAYQGNRNEAEALALDDEPIAAEIIRLVDDEASVKGTAAELLSLLDARATEQERKAQGRPSSPRGLTASLDRLAPALLATGIVVKRLPGKTKRGRTISLEQTRKEPSQRSQPSPVARSDGDGRGDGRHEPSPVQGQPSPVFVGGSDGGDGSDGRSQSNSNEGDWREV